MLDLQRLAQHSLGAGANVSLAAALRLATGLVLQKDKALQVSKPSTWLRALQVRESP